jgi:hypothetical protein
MSQYHHHLFSSSLFLSHIHIHTSSPLHSSFLLMPSSSARRKHCHQCAEWRLHCLKTYGGDGDHKVVSYLCERCEEQWCVQCHPKEAKELGSMYHCVEHRNFDECDTPPLTSYHPSPPPSS